MRRVSPSFTLARIIIHRVYRVGESVWGYKPLMGHEV